MLDTELYTHLLGISSPWFVSHVDLSIANQQVEVWAEHLDGDHFACPDCAKILPIYDHAPERTWRHLDSCQFKTYLKARVPSVQCDEHGVKTVRVSWAEPKSRFTLLFERLAIDVLKACDIQSAARLLHLSWDEANLIKQRAVARGLSRRTTMAATHLGVDEKAFRRGHRYMTLVTDLKEGHEGTDPFALVVSEHRVGKEVFCQMVFLGNAQSPAADDRSGTNVTPTPRRDPELLSSWHNQCYGGRGQLQGAENHHAGERVQK